MLGIGFVHPAVLYAAAAAAAPVLIHLILRTKPRRIVFPAMRFVRKTHRSTLKMLKLKHLILLAMRMAVVVLMAVLIARGQAPRRGVMAEASAPTAAVVVIDNSGSMNYRYQGQTLLTWAQQQAQRLIAALPQGSVAAVLTTGGSLPGQRSPSGGPLRLGAARLAAPSLVVQQVAELPAGYSSAQVGPALGQAVELVRSSSLPRKQVVLLTDLTAVSWRQEPAVREARDIQFAVLHAGGEDLNVRLGAVSLSATAVPLGAEVKLQTELGSLNVGGDMTVVVDLDGQAVWQQTVPLAAGGSATISAGIKPARQGAVHGRVVLNYPDPLDMDNVRYFTLQVGPPAKVLIVCSPATAAGAGFLMGNAVAPAVGESFVQRQTVLTDQLDAQRLNGVRLVMLAEAASLSEDQWALLDGFVRNGGGLWVVLGPLVSPAAYNVPAAQKLLPAALQALEQLSRPMGWRNIAADHPLLAPFAGGDNPPLSQVQCTGRFRLAWRAEDAQVLAEYADGAPALMVRRVGEGTVVLWNFSPLPGQSNLATLPQLPILAARTASVLAAEPGTPTLYRIGQDVTIPIPRSLTAAVATVRRPGSAVDDPLLPDPTRPVVRLTADALGQWTVRFTQGQQVLERGFSVDADPAESDLTPEDTSRIRGLFPPGCLTMAAEAGELAQRRRVVSQVLDLAPLVLLGLLALMIGESFFANRFYRQDPSPAPGP